MKTLISIIIVGILFLAFSTDEKAKNLCEKKFSQNECHKMLNGR